MGKKKPNWTKFDPESPHNGNERSKRKDHPEPEGNAKLDTIGSEIADIQINKSPNYSPLDGNKEYQKDSSNKERINDGRNHNSRSKVLIRSGSGSHRHGNNEIFSSEKQSYNYENNDKPRIEGSNESSSSKNKIFSEKKLEVFQTNSFIQDNRDINLRENEKVLSTERYKDRYEEPGASKYKHLDNRNNKDEIKNNPRNYTRKYDENHEHSEISTKQNESYNQRNNLERSSSHNEKFRKGMEGGKGAYTRKSDDQTSSAENRSWRRGYNPERRSNRADERRVSYTSDIKGRRNNYGESNFNQNFNRRTDNSHHEGLCRKDTSQKYSDEKDMRPLSYSTEYQTFTPDGHIDQIEDWDDPANECSWDVQNISTSIPDDQGTTSSYHDDPYNTTPLPNYQVQLVSPGSSKLNPDALSFGPTDINKQSIDECEENEAQRVKDADMSTELHALRNESYSPTYDRDDDNVNSLPLTKRREQNETGAIRKNSRDESDWRTKHDKKKKRENNSASAASQPKQYSGVLSTGTTITVDQNVSMNSEISIDETRSEYPSRKEDYNKSYIQNVKNSRWSGGRSNRDSSFEDRSPRNFPPSRKSLNMLFDNSAMEGDKELAEFEEYVESANAGQFVKVTEEDKDLFSVGEDYSLAHCVAEDMNMGSGIAVEFRRKFKRVPELLKMRERTGGLAVLEDKGRYIYYMVTKKISSGKPTYGSFWKSLKKLRDHMKQHEVEKLAIPRIGCGLDRLNWNIVKMMVEFLFKSMDVSILVCNFQQDESFSSPSVPRSKKCKIVHESYPITDIDQGTMIVYFASADGLPTPCMLELDKKFNFSNAFKLAKKNLGDVVRFEDRIKNYILYGCIVKEKTNDLFDFVSLGKCLTAIQKLNRKDGFVYLGFQRIQDDRDDILNEKVLNIISHLFSDVDIYCCNSGT